jgi:hypothetical protein
MKHVYVDAADLAKVQDQLADLKSKAVVTISVLEQRCKSLERERNSMAPLALLLFRACSDGLGLNEIEAQAALVKAGIIECVPYDEAQHGLIDAIPGEKVYMYSVSSAKGCALRLTQRSLPNENNAPPSRHRPTSAGRMYR